MKAFLCPVPTKAGVNVWFLYCQTGKRSLPFQGSMTTDYSIHPPCGFQVLSFETVLLLSSPFIWCKHLPLSGTLEALDVQDALVETRGRTMEQCQSSINLLTSPLSTTDPHNAFSLCLLPVLKPLLRLANQGFDVVLSCFFCQRESKPRRRKVLQTAVKATIIPLCYMGQSPLPWQGYHCLCLTPSLFPLSESSFLEDKIRHILLFCCLCINLFLICQVANKLPAPRVTAPDKTGLCSTSCVVLWPLNMIGSLFLFFF